MDLSYLQQELKKLNNEISYILDRSGFSGYQTLGNVEFDKHNPNAQLLNDEFLHIMHHLEDVKITLDYLNREIIGEYILHKNELGKYECSERDIVYHCGQTIEYYTYDDFSECYKWVISHIEHDGNDYYIVGDRSTTLNGLTVRIRRCK